MVQELVDDIGCDVPRPFVSEVLKDFRVEIVELAASLGAVSLPPVVRKLCERDSVECPCRKTNARRDFGFSLGEDVLRDLRRSLLRALAHIIAVFRTSLSNGFSSSRSGQTRRSSAMTSQRSVRRESRETFGRRAAIRMRFCLASLS